MPRKFKKQKYNYFYKITNIINGKFYYGVHKTNDLDDGYLGSGTRLKYAILKHGIDFFKKDIIKFFDNYEDALIYESEIVNENLLKDAKCYNLKKGGIGGWDHLKNNVVVRDNSGNTKSVSKDDPDYLNGNLVDNLKGKMPVKDKTGKTIFIDVNDPKILDGEYSFITKGKVAVKDKLNNFFHVDVDDPRYKSGELKFIWCGKKLKKQSIEKMKKTFKKIGHQQGEKNSNYNTCWIYNEKQKISKKIKKEELKKYIDDNWKKGRKMTF